VDSYSKTLTFLRGVYLPLAMKNAS
jgi:hypothetical protein